MGLVMGKGKKYINRNKKGMKKCGILIGNMEM